MTTPTEVQSDEVSLEVIEPEPFDPQSHKPKLFEILPLKWGVEKPADLPEALEPYFVMTAEGLYIVKQGYLGKSVLPHKGGPPNLTNLPKEFKNGVFFYQAAPIPARLMAQVVDFFKAVWDKHKAEAEVLILFSDSKPKNRQYQIFVPFQKVTGGSVRSGYDPEDIPAGYHVIGSMHSHCNFSAFHSGTDKDDASTFNGLHITIGFLQREMPEFAVMVVINGQEFHYNKSLSIIADVSDLTAVKHNPRWMNFLLVEKGGKEKHKSPVANQLETWGGRTSSSAPKGTYPTPPSYTGGGSHYVPREWKRTGYGSKKSYWNDLRAHFPTEWFEDIRQGYYNNNRDLKEEFLPDAFAAVLDDICDVANEYGFSIQYNMIDRLAIQEMAKKAEEKDEDIAEETPSPKLKELLPGPMEVRDADDENTDDIDEQYHKLIEANFRALD